MMTTRYGRHRRLVEWTEAMWYGAPISTRLLWLRWLLRPLEAAYRTLVALRRAAYRRGLKKTVSLSVPVIVVGNLTVGGTGKTPVVIWLAEELGRRGWCPGIVSRGYGGRSESWPRSVDVHADPREVGDEPVLIAERTGCPVVVGPDRVAAARHLLERAKVDVVLSDDGLQHYRLGRCIELAVVDGQRGLGNGRCLPAGPLREPASRLAETDAVIVNGAGFARAGAFRAALRPARVRRVGGSEEAVLEEWAGRRVHAAAGIGNPWRFFDLLSRAGLDVVPHPLPDHADIGPRDLDFHGPRTTVVTEKDAVKCRTLGHDDLWCVAVDLRFDNDDGERLMRQVIDKLEMHAAGEEGRDPKVTEGTEGKAGAAAAQPEGRPPR